MPTGPDLEQVYDSILGRFREEWELSAGAVVGGAAPDVEWPDEPEHATPLSKGVVPWARVAMRHGYRGVTTIGSQLPGQGRIAADGTVMVNIFVPAGGWARSQSQPSRASARVTSGSPTCNPKRQAWTARGSSTTSKPRSTTITTSDAHRRSATCPQVTSP